MTENPWRERIGVAAVIPAKDEAERIGATIASLQHIDGIDLIVVVDDGSSDDTGAVAEAAGALVVRHSKNRGKAAAMESGARRVAEEESKGGAPADRPLLFVDADLADTARNLGVLIPPVVTGQADMTIAILPPQEGSAGGRGLVVNLARDGIAELSDWQATQPLSGMRCISRAAFETARPLARGWGVETGLTIDVLRAGLIVAEVPCQLQHRVSGTDWRGQLHRAAQYRDVWLALRARRRRGRA